MKKEIEVREQPTIKSFCPFIQEPSDNCYCSKLTSQAIEKVVLYCNKNFEICEIYKTRNNKDNGE